MSATTSLRPRRFSCAACPFQHCEGFRNFTPEELAFVEGFKKGELFVEKGRTILTEGADSRYIYTVLSGWGYRYKTLEDGRRQILNFVLPAHFLGLQASTLREMQHSVDALTDMVLCVFERDRIWDLFTSFPSLAFDVTWLSSREEMMLDQHLTNVGRRTAIERLAFLLLHLYERARVVGLAGDDKVRFPFTQQQLADALGLSLVHTNKTIKRLAKMGLLSWDAEACIFPDRAALAELVGYEADKNLLRPFI